MRQSQSHRWDLAAMPSSLSLFFLCIVIPLLFPVQLLPKAAKIPSLRSLGLFISYPLNYQKRVQYISPKRLLFVPKQALLKVWCRILTRLKKKGQKKFGPLVCKETRTVICISKLAIRSLRRLVTGEACRRLSDISLRSRLL